jgi:diguanylate cyclase (GGDEF)-like protein/PAS domain S-box-containing protein
MRYEKTQQAPGELRRQVEATMSTQKKMPQQLTKADTLRMIHELQVHQIELEMQNEVLVQARAEAEQVFREYTNLYDFAPVGYFTLGRDGAIRQVNLAGANLLGVERVKLLNRRLGLFVYAESRPVLNAFLEKLLSCDGKEICELAFLKNETEVLWARLEATCFEGGQECRAVAVDITQRKQMEQALQESENRFRTILQNVSTIAVQGYASDGTTQYWNSASERLYGYSAQEAIGQSLLDLIIPPEMRGDVWHAIQQMAESGQSIPAAELSLMKKDGSRVTVYSSHAVVSIPGRMPELFCLDVDLTERKLVAALLQARIRISEFADSNPLEKILQKALDEAEPLTASRFSFAYLLDTDQKTIKMQALSTNAIENVHTAKETGDRYSPDQAGVWTDCISTRAPVICNDHAILRELVVPVLHHDQLVMIMRVCNKPTDYDNSDVEALSQLGNSVWDIIQRKRAEDALKSSEKKYRLLHESMIDGFVSVGMDGEILECNEVYRIMLGYSEAELTQLTYEDLTPEKWHGFENDILKNQIIKRGYSDIYEKEYIRKDGTVFPVELHTVLLRDEQGNPARMWAIVRDITERVRAEQTLKAANSELQAALAREQQLAYTDGLTGINNRRRLFELAEHEFEIAARYQQPLSVMMFDIDHFKRVNDTFGHAVGDQILQLVARIASMELRSADVIGRYGGEEFVILLPMTNAQQAYPLAERVRERVEAIRVPTEKGDASVTLSIGIAQILHDPQTGSADELISRADETMYAAKQAGRNRTKIEESKSDN